MKRVSSRSKSLRWPRTNERIPCIVVSPPPQSATSTRRLVSGSASSSRSDSVTAATPEAFAFAPGEAGERAISPSRKQATIRIRVGASWTRSSQVASTPAIRAPIGISSRRDRPEPDPRRRGHHRQPPRGALEQAHRQSVVGGAGPRRVEVRAEDHPGGAGRRQAIAAARVDVLRRPPEQQPPHQVPATGEVQVGGGRRREHDREPDRRLRRREHAADDRDQAMEQVDDRPLRLDPDRLHSARPRPPTRARR